MKNKMTDLQKELLMATMDSMVLALFCAANGGAALATGNTLFAVFNIAVALFNVKRADTRYFMYKEQRALIPVKVTSNDLRPKD